MEEEHAMDIKFLNGSKLTYGEAMLIEKSEIKMVKGNWVKGVYVTNKAKPMSRTYKKGGSEIARYYNNKMRQLMQYDI